MRCSAWNPAPCTREKLAAASILSSVFRSRGELLEVAPHGLPEKDLVLVKGSCVLREAMIGKRFGDGDVDIFNAQRLKRCLQAFEIVR